MIWPFTTIATLRRELSDARIALLKMEAEIEGAVKREERRLAEIARLSWALEEARKNDTAKDAKTGKFTKKKTKDE